MALTDEARSHAIALIEGAGKTIKNADELFDEARILAEAGHVARALLLHQISLEECGKAEMLHVAVLEVLRGKTVDMKRLARAFSKHSVKNNTNSYFLPESEAESNARAAKDIGAAAAAFTELQGSFSEGSNDLKNASLYVDFSNGKFVAPGEVITPAYLEDIYQRNGAFMSMAIDRLRLLMRWATDLDAAAEETAQIWDAFGLNALDRDKPETLWAVMDRVKTLLSAATPKAQPKSN